MSSSTNISPLGSYRGSSSAMDRRGWNLALSFQEVFTAIVRLRSRKQDVPNAEAFRGQMKQALRAAEQEAVSRGYPTRHFPSGPGCRCKRSCLDTN